MGKIYGRDEILEWNSGTKYLKNLNSTNFKYTVVVMIEPEIRPHNIGTASSYVTPWDG